MLQTAVLAAQRRPDVARGHRPSRRHGAGPSRAQVAIRAKIRRLRAEGYPQRQAVAMALSMAREGRLGPRGGYRRA
jgi:hypothetical protein